MGKKALLNFSSHALSDKAKVMLGAQFQIIEEIFFDHVDFQTEIKDQLEQVLLKVNCPLDGSIPITIIVPGQATVAVLLISYLSGIIGHIPNICLLEMDKDGFYIPTNIFFFNGNQLRSDGRKFRQEMWQKN